MNVELTDFAIQRHFSADRAGTVITDRTPEQFQIELNERDDKLVRVDDGYADFCKLLFIRNWTNVRAGTLEIADENRHFLRSDYKARKDGELPVLIRWFEGVEVPVAKYLCVVVYSKEQLAKEDTVINADYGVVAILGQTHAGEEPINPITKMRNALGISEGGSGVALDRKAYMESVRFWQSHATVKS